MLISNKNDCELETIQKYIKKNKKFIRNRKRKNRKIKPITTKTNSTETDPEMTEVMELANKNIKTAIVNMLHIFKKVDKMQNYDEDRNEKF